MNIVIGNNTLKQGTSGNITGKIFVEVDDYYFPEENWNDFPIIILSCWINNYLNSRRSKVGKFEMCFMDGPFLLKGELVDNELYKIKLIGRELENTGQELETYLTSKEIQEMFLKASRKILREAELSCISQEKLQGLKKILKELKNL